MKILNRWDGSVLFESDGTLVEVVLKAVAARANLGSANLCSANLYGANLRSADLRGANLHGAKGPRQAGTGFKKAKELPLP